MMRTVDDYLRKQKNVNVNIFKHYQRSTTANQIMTVPVAANRDFIEFYSTERPEKNDSFELSCIA